MARIISLVNQKGGVGKTTTAINIAAGLAEAGKYVLLIDIDPQGNATSGLGINLTEVTAGTYEVLLGNKKAEEVTKATAVERLSVMPATPALAGATVELVPLAEREKRLDEALVETRHKFDYVIIDNPPSLGIITVNALVASDAVIIPVQAEYYALEGLGQLLSTIDLVRTNLNPRLGVMGAVITMYDKRTRLSAQVMKEIERHFPGKVFNSIIPRNVRISEAPSFGQSIYRYDPFSRGAFAYRSLVKEIISLEL